METTMTAIETADASLSWDVLSIRRPGLTRDLPAGREELMWVANSSTLIHGERDAVLVDTFLTTEQSQTLLNWVVASGKNLTAIYVTHAHGDHFLASDHCWSVSHMPGRSRHPRSLRPCTNK